MVPKNTFENAFSQYSSIQYTPDPAPLCGARIKDTQPRFYCGTLPSTTLPRSSGWPRRSCCRSSCCSGSRAARRKVSELAVSACATTNIADGSHAKSTARSPRKHAGIDKQSAVRGQRCRYRVEDAMRVAERVGHAEWPFETKADAAAAMVIPKAAVVFR